MTPIFMRIWLMKMTSVLERLMFAVSLRSAWLMRRACRPICGSPISPSISAFGVSAEREIEAERAGGHDFDRAIDVGRTQFHDGALAELLLDLRKRGREGLRLVLVHSGGACFGAGDDFEHFKSHSLVVGHVVEASRS